MTPSRGSASARLPTGAALAWARRDTRAARARLERIYGGVPPVVFLYDRGVGEPVRMACAGRLVGRVSELYRGDRRPVRVRAVVPGGRPLMEWFRARQQGWSDERRTDDVRAFGWVHERHDFTVAYGSDGIGRASCEVLRILDKHLADVECLYRRGVSVTEMAELAGVERAEMRRTVERMRALGFDMPHRNAYAKRTGASPR